MISRENRDIMERKLGRRLEPDTKVTLTVENLSKILDAVREEERGGGSDNFDSSYKKKAMDGINGADIKGFPKKFW